MTAQPQSAPDVAAEPPGPPAPLLLAPPPLAQPESLATRLWRFTRAQLSSGLATFVDWALLTSLIALHVHYLVALAFGAVAGAVTDFTVKKHWVFDAGDGALSSQAPRYAAVSLASLVWNEILAYALVDGLHWPKVPGVIAGSIVVGFVWNYPMHRYVVFRPATKPNP